MAEKGSIKRVTNNFNMVCHYGPDSIKVFQKWKEEQIENGVPMIFDRRNDIYCVGPTFDYEMYYNYLMYLNANRSDWHGNGYFDMGMVPYMMWPSFMSSRAESSEVLEQMRNIARQFGINLVQVPSISFLKTSYSMNGLDYWIFREDLFKLCKCLEQISPAYKFDINSPEEATLSKFVYPLAQIAKQHRRS